MKINNTRFTHVTFTVLKKCSPGGISAENEEMPMLNAHDIYTHYIKTITVHRAYNTEIPSASITSSNIYILLLDVLVYHLKFQKFRK